MNAEQLSYPFIYIPGMFDNGDLLTEDSLLVKNLNNKDGYYFKNYFLNRNEYNKDLLICSSNIINAKYNRLMVANLIGPYRTNISLWLMADRFFALMHGYAPKFKSYKNLINYKGNDFDGTINIENKTIHFKGIIEEIWAKYGKRVYYAKKLNKNRIILNTDNQNNTNFYINKDGYFNNPSEIKFNLIVHSSGGIALRRYLQICNKEKINNHINTIINLSVPQKGARLVYELKNAFPLLLNDAMNNFWKNRENKITSITDSNGKILKYTYNELIDKTKINIIHGDSFQAKTFRKIIGNYIINKIPFDGYKRVLNGDPTLKDLHPDHRLINTLNNEPIPDNIKIYNFRVKSAYALMFKNLSKYLNLNKNDGVVDFRDTDLNHIPNSSNLKITDYIVDKANHIPFPYIKPVFELQETITQYYGFLKILLKKDQQKDQGINLLHALLKTIMIEFGLDLQYLLENENYSVIDYFAENPIIFWD
jgi:hypothetical protein